ncbi:MAG: ferritin-like domain-containing protein [Chloroflexi bacterium]|nr:ferritin-like domain-containing protein [Chloroflexota bacterium]
MASGVRQSKSELYEELKGRPHIRRYREGDYRPGAWFDADPGTEDWGTWGTRAKPSKRGLTLMDINAADGVPVPDVGPPVMVTRGGAWRSDAPPRQWEVNDKYLIWSDNVVSLYEEGASRQWSATRDIPWESLTPLPPELERAYCQFMTHLASVEYTANDSLAPWAARINTTFHEVKFFLYQQMVDEARHSEVFRKRALAGGGGLGVSNAYIPGLPLSGQANPFRQKLNDDFNALSYFIQFLSEGIFLDNFRFCEFLAQTDVDRIIFGRVMQDEARHVSYGVMRLKYYLEHAPDRQAALDEMHAIADEAEILKQSVDMVNPQILEPLAIMAGGGVDRMEQGMDVYRQVWTKVVEEYLRRCDVAGFPRRDRTYLFHEPPF